MAEIKEEKTGKVKLSRREALWGLMSLVAFAGGFTSAEVKKLMAQVKSEKNLKDLISVNAKSFEAKVIKALLFPEPEVYMMEFRRQIDPFISGMETCRLFLGGNDCSSLRACYDNGCNSQDCPKLGWCDGNTCSGQTRMGKLNTSDMLGPRSLERIKNDPFIQALFERLNVTSSLELSKELKYLLSKQKVR